MSVLTPFAYWVFPFVLFLFSSIHTFGQTTEREVTASGGEHFSNSGSSLSWTLGEPVTETVGNSSLTLTQGFQQSNIEVTAIGEVSSPTFKVNVYPNPAVDFVNVEWQSEQGEPITVRLYDMNGKELIYKETKDSKMVLDFVSIPAANYLLSISKNNGEFIRSYLIQKTK